VISTRLHLPHPHRRANRGRGAARLVDPAPTEREAQVRPLSADTSPSDASAPDRAVPHSAALRPAAPPRAVPHHAANALQPPELDRDACKVREAGGPLDVAAYVCLCGFAFAAAVSSSVQCPHCGAPQAW
jgi:hypothetical protein